MPVLSAPTVLVQRVGLQAGWRCGLTRGLLYESIGMSPVWSGGVCSRFALPVWAGYPSCVENVEIPLGCMKLGSCDLGVFPLQLPPLQECIDSVHRLMVGWAGKELSQRQWHVCTVGQPGFLYRIQQLLRRHCQGSPGIPKCCVLHHSLPI